MRAGLALIAAFALCVTPALAQGKTKVPPQPGALAALEACSLFAGAVVDAKQQAGEMGWDVREGVAESPFVETRDFYSEIPGLGYAEGYVLVETYPNVVFGYCRIDVYEPEGEADVALIDDLPQWQGELKTEGAGTYGSWQGGEGEQRNMLLSHEDEYGFVLQLTMMQPKAQTDAEAE